MQEICWGDVSRWSVHAHDKFHQIYGNKGAWDLVVIARGGVVGSSTTATTTTTTEKLNKTLHGVIQSTPQQTVWMWGLDKTSELPVNCQGNATKDNQTRHCASICPQGTLQLGICGMHHLLAVSLLWLGIFQFFLKVCSCLAASGVGKVGYFQLFGKTKKFQTNPSNPFRRLFWDVPAGYPHVCVASSLVLWCLLQKDQHYHKTGHGSDTTDEQDVQCEIEAEADTNCLVRVQLLAALWACNIRQAAAVSSISAVISCDSRTLIQNTCFICR